MINNLETTNNKLSKLPVKISGQWINSENRDWQGEVSSTELIVGVAILECEDVISWCKSNRDYGQNQKIRLGLFPYDKTNVEVQVSFSVGNANVRLSSFVESANYKPQIASIFSSETGEIYKFAQIEGSPNIILSVIVLPQQNVKFGRNGIWHLKTKIEHSLPAKISEILAGGRSGQIKRSAE